MSENTLFLVDGSGFIFRAYHALPPMNRPDGTPVNAVLGFTNMLIKLLKDMDAPNIAVIFDAARKNFRNEIYAEYKAHRPPAPEDLVPQFGLIREATEAFDIPSIELEGYEADDLIASYTKLARAQGKEVVIVSSDKDLMQLIKPGVKMFDAMKSRYFDEEDVLKKFGVKPDKVIEVQALMGDSVDNVPGVPGIGPKTASQLIDQYGDLETLLERAEEIPQNKRRESLIEHAEAARISKKLVTLDENVEVPLALEDLTARDPESPKLMEFLAEQGFKSVMARLGQAMPNGQNASAESSQALRAPSMPAIKDNEYVLINDIETLKSWMQDALEEGVLAVDTETTHLTPAKADLVGISIASKLGKGAYIPVGHIGTRDLLGGSNDSDIPQLTLEDVIGVMKPVLEDGSVMKVFHNAKYDLQMFMAHGVNVTPVDDTMLLSYTLDGNSMRHGMDTLSESMFGHAPIKYEEVAGKGKSQVTFDQVSIEKALDYAAEDAEITLRLYKMLKPRVAQEKMVALYEHIERPLSHVIARMENHGIKVDAHILKRMSQDFAVKIDALEKQIHEIAGTPFNVGSPKQIGEILFDQMGLPHAKKTKSGQWSTDVNTLEKLAAEDHEIVVKILEWRQLSKLKSTYTDALQDQINPKTGRIHTSYSLAATSTGRLASSDPNLQNIPIRSEEGRKIREAFIAEDGYKLISVDYSQVELRLAAEIAGIEALKLAFKDGQDIHAATASEVFDIPLADMDPDTRAKAKAINFGIIYGISKYGLARQLKITSDEAGEYIAKYFGRFPELRTYMDTTVENAKKTNFVTTYFGRKCYVGSINDKNGQKRAFAERAAINAPLQGTAADIIKKAMIKIDKAILTGEIEAKMLLQVHDELIFEVPEDRVDQVLTQVKEIMEGVVSFSIPLLAEGGAGDSWGQAH